MNSSLRNRIGTMSLALSLLTISSAAPMYQVIPIGDWPGATSGTPMAINNQNVVAGTSFGDGAAYGWVYSEQGGMSTYAFPWNNDHAYRDINDAGQTTGYSLGWGSAIRAESGQVFGWNTPVGYERATGWGINNLGVMAGWSISNTQGVPTRATRFNSNFTGTLLPVLNANANSQARRINDSGVICGISDEKAVLWTANNTLVNLHAMIPGAVESYAYDINEAGWVTGHYVTAQNSVGEFRFNFETGMQLLPTLGQNLITRSEGINAHGETVGATRPSANSGPNVAYLRSSLGVMVDLNDCISPSSGWQLTRATAINDNGYIAGVGVFRGVQTNFLLRPVPEPSTIVALGVGFLMTAKRRRRLKS